MRLLEKTSAFKFEWNIFHPSGGTARERGFNQRLEDVPNLVPDLADGPTERPRVLGAENRYIGVVVYRTKFRSPPEQLGESVREEKLHNHPESRGPRGCGTEGSPRPISLANELSHLAPARKKVGCGRAPGIGGIISGSSHARVSRGIGIVDRNLFVQGRPPSDLIANETYTMAVLPANTGVSLAAYSDFPMTLRPARREGHEVLARCHTLSGRPAVSNRQSIGRFTLRLGPTCYRTFTPYFCVK